MILNAEIQKSLEFIEITSLLYYIMKDFSSDFAKFNKIFIKYFFPLVKTT